MNPTTYLKQLKEFTPDKLTSKLGIYDNWIIFFKSDFKKSLDFFINSPNYKLIKKAEKADGTPFYGFDHEKIYVHFRLAETPLRFKKDHPLLYKHLNKIHPSTDFNTQIIAFPFHEHDYFSKNFKEDDSWKRSLSDLIIELTENFLLKQELSFCFINSIGRDYFGPDGEVLPDYRDFSKVVVSL